MKKDTKVVIFVLIASVLLIAAIASIPLLGYISFKNQRAAIQETGYVNQTGDVINEVKPDQNVGKIDESDPKADTCQSYECVLYHLSDLKHDEVMEKIEILSYKEGNSGILQYKNGGVEIYSSKTKNVRLHFVGSEISGENKLLYLIEGRGFDTDNTTPDGDYYVLTYDLKSRKVISENKLNFEGKVGALIPQFISSEDNKYIAIHFEIAGVGCSGPASKEMSECIKGIEKMMAGTTYRNALYVYNRTKNSTKLVYGQKFNTEPLTKISIDWEVHNLNYSLDHTYYPDVAN